MITNSQNRPLAQAVTAFASALKDWRRTVAPATAQYPHDADTMAALVLHRWLAEAYPDQVFFFVSGERYRPTWCSHAWVQCGDLLIDITGRGFGAPRAVMITTSRSWHSQFSVTDKRHHVYSDYEDRSDRLKLDAAFDAIERRIFRATPSHDRTATAA